MTRAKINNLANILSIISTFVLAIEIVPFAGADFMILLFGGFANVDLIGFQIFIIMMILPPFIEIMANCFIKIRSILLAINAIIKLAVAILFIIVGIMLPYGSIILVLPIVASAASAGTLICLLISNLCCNKYSA